VRYSSYGVPFGMPQGDVNGDGTVDGADLGQILADWGTGTVACDVNLDGTVDGADHALALANDATTLGRGVLSDIGNRRGYAGYEADMIRDTTMHVRHRVYDAGWGHWPGV